MCSPVGGRNWQNLRDEGLRGDGFLNVTDETELHRFAVAVARHRVAGYRDQRRCASPGCSRMSRAAS